MKDSRDDAVVTAPVIETDRLRLRAHRAEDFVHCAAMWSDPEVVRFIGGKPSSLQQTWARMLAYAGHWRFVGFGYWLIEEKRSGTFLGEAGLADFKRDIDASMRDVPELGFAFAARAHGQGFATESVRAILAWADARLIYPKTVCLIDPRNLASLRVAEKCGYAISERATYNAQPSLFLSRARPLPSPATKAQRNETG